MNITPLLARRSMLGVLQIGFPQRPVRLGIAVFDVDKVRFVDHGSAGPRQTLPPKVVT